MTFSYQTYQFNNLKKIIYNNNFLFFYTGINKNRWDQLSENQKLKNLNFLSHKILKKIVKILFNNSIYINNKHLLNSFTFFLYNLSQKKFIKKSNFIKIKALNFTLLGVKLNNKIFALNHFTKAIFLNYKENKFYFFKFLDISFIKLQTIISHIKSK